jgi:UDP-glucose 4-epimerase
MKNVLITGVSGYLGTLLAKRIAQEPEVEHLIGMDIKEPSFISPKFTFIKHDVRQPFADIFIKNKIDTAIHFAFIVAPIHAEKMAHEINIKGSQNFMEAATQAKVEQVFYMGSYAAYGAWANNPKTFTEDMPLNPNLDFPYPADKAEVDHMFQKFASEHPKIKVTIGRTAAVTGPGGEKCGLTVLFLPIMIKPIGLDSTWQFIHEDDLVDIITLLAKQRKAGIFNFTAQGAYKYSEIIKMLGKPSIPLPSWLLYWGIKITWRLKLQSKAQAGALRMIQYSTLMSGEKLIKETGYKYRYTGPEAFDIFLEVMGKKKPTSCQ